MPCDSIYWHVETFVLAVIVWYFQVIGIPDVSSIYRVPLLIESQHILEDFTKRLNLPLPIPRPRRLLAKWQDLAERWMARSKWARKYNKIS